MSNPFRVGDRIKYQNTNSLQNRTLGRIYRVLKITTDKVYSMNDRGFESFTNIIMYPDRLVLVEREHIELPLATLIKRANLGIKALREIMDKHGSKTTISDKDGLYIVSKSFGALDKLDWSTDIIVKESING